MINLAAKVLGIVFLIIGILGFIPTASPHGMLFGLFYINPLHNIVHLLTGGIGLWVGGKNEDSAILFFQVIGIIYAIVAILGFIYKQGAIFGILANNHADAWLHLVIAVGAIYLGFFKKR